jgi:hypothetical protein
MLRIIVLLILGVTSFASSAANAQGPATPFRPEILTQPVFPSWCGRTFSPLCDVGWAPYCAQWRECNYFGRQVTECVGWLCRDATGRGLDTFDPHGRRAPGAGRLRSRR